MAKQPTKPSLLEPCSHRYFHCLLAFIVPVRLQSYTSGVIVLIPYFFLAAGLFTFSDPVQKKKRTVQLHLNQPQLLRAYLKIYYSKEELDKGHNLRESLLYLNYCGGC
jgi:hypothetical protein